ncbi:hypothetical protein ZIOFF_061431 [Zingiber officinale]|uniref:protein-serine/threonine phosphatase n=1 Tax=Zingiber officinale TaxID=94328 RepID=A0A8J5F405_ZINOF|nr:hypothetical protein ZIOFF_061431 [Zingiber officinale]
MAPKWVLWLEMVLVSSSCCLIASHLLRPINLTEDIKVVPFVKFFGKGHSGGAGKGKSSQDSVKVTYGFSLVKGRANHPMEDYHVAKCIQIRGQEIGLFAIFDGHLGDNVAAYLQKHLFTNILKEFGSDEVDQLLLTAILIDGRKLRIANVGDSRAVLAKGDVPRVNGQLAVSRAFGDKSLKSHLRSDPDMHYEDVTANNDLLILASDGLWKVMSNEEAVNIARKSKDPQAAARLLTMEAVNRVRRMIYLA